MAGVGKIMNGVVFLGTDGTVRLMNAVAEDLLDVKSVLAVGRPFRDLQGCAELIQAVAGDLSRLAERAETSRTVEVHHGRQDLLYIKTTTTRVAGHDGSDAGAILVLQDVTEEYKTDQLKNQYLSIVAHELRTPLTGIKTFSTMMSKGTLGPLNDRQKRVVESIREQSLRLEHQIDKLINIGHLDSSDYERDLEVFEVRELVEAAVAPFLQVAEERGIRFSHGSPQGVYLQADKADLKRALQALIENAVKFTTSGGSTRVEATATQEGVLFEVRDTGIGIDPRYHRRIFEKFFQVEDPLTRHHGGAGLGLFVAHGVLEAHGSVIQVESELGRGSCFSFCLPEYVPGEAPGARRPVPESITS